jgi:hypothetical protein
VPHLCPSLSATGWKNDNCRKLSWKVDTNYFAGEDSKQKIWGLKKLNFHGLAVPIPTLLTLLSLLTLLTLPILIALLIPMPLLTLPFSLGG